MKDGIIGLLWSVAICAAIVAVVFGVLGELIALDFALSIAYFTSKVFAISIYAIVALWVIGFDWMEMPFIKATGAGVLMAVLSYLVFAFFEWSLFYTLFVLFAVVAAVAVVIGLIKTIFG